MLGKASVVKTRNQVKDIPVHQERFFLFIRLTFAKVLKNKIPLLSLTRNLYITKTLKTVFLFVFSEK